MHLLLYNNYRPLNGPTHGWTAASRLSLFSPLFQHIKSPFSIRATTSLPVQEYPRGHILSIPCRTWRACMYVCGSPCVIIAHCSCPFPRKKKEKEEERGKRTFEKELTHQLHHGSKSAGCRNSRKDKKEHTLCIHVGYYYIYLHLAVLNRKLCWPLQRSDVI